MPPVDLFGLSAGNALLVIGTLLITAGLLASTLLTARSLRTRDLTFNPLLSPLDILLRLVLIAACYGMALSSTLPARTFGLVLGDVPVEAAIGIGAGLLLAGFLIATGALATRIWGPGVADDRVVRAILPRNGWEWFLVPLVMAPAVLLEELLFRGLIVGGLGTWVDPWVLAIGFSVVFGLMHAPQGRVGVVLAFLASLVLSALFLWRGSLVAPVLAHYVANVTQLLVLSWSVDRERAAAEAQAVPDATTAAEPAAIATPAPAAGDAADAAAGGADPAPDDGGTVESGTTPERTP